MKLENVLEKLKKKKKLKCYELTDIMLFQNNSQCALMRHCYISMWCSFGRPLLTLGREEGLSDTRAALTVWPSSSVPSTSTMWSSSFVLGSTQAWLKVSKTHPSVLDSFSNWYLHSSCRVSMYHSEIKLVFKVIVFRVERHILPSLQHNSW